MSAERPRETMAATRARGQDARRLRGRLFVLSAPSGAGKSTLCRLLRAQRPDLRYSISYTTRPPRPGEVDGVDYFFIDEAGFTQGIAEGRWVEWARVHDHYYGTAAAFIDDMLDQGHDLLLDIDVQGAAQLVKLFPDAVTIFIMPPSMDVLRQRLEERGTDSAGVIDQRLRNAMEEIAARFRYRHVVVNAKLERAVDELLAILAPNENGARGSDGSTPDPGK
ncbi:MAG: guanylate kinase [Desulfobacterales bacterium]|nr:guanylate kinase [Desulfobacterales bacterium]MDJ0875467.1 guanylate kinase [Desulfobacterales bacterium]